MGVLCNQASSLPTKIEPAILEVQMSFGISPFTEREQSKNSQNCFCEFLFNELHREVRYRNRHRKH